MNTKSISWKPPRRGYLFPRKEVVIFGKERRRKKCYFAKIPVQPPFEDSDEEELYYIEQELIKEYMTRPSKSNATQEDDEDSYDATMN